MVVQMITGLLLQMLSSNSSQEFVKTIFHGIRVALNYRHCFLILVFIKIHYLNV